MCPLATFLHPSGLGFFYKINGLDQRGSRRWVYSGFSCIFTECYSSLGVYSVNMMWKVHILCLCSHSNAGLLWSLFRLHLLWKSGRQLSARLRLFPECMFYLGCLMPVSNGICQLKMLDAKFVERKVYLSQSGLSEYIRHLGFLFQVLFSTKEFCAHSFRCGGTDFTFQEFIKCWSLKSHAHKSEQALCASVLSIK